jgi:hypothetical protein
LRRLADEALGMSAVGGIENSATPFNRFRSQTMVDHSRREKAQSGMAVLVVILGKELLERRFKTTAIPYSGIWSPVPRSI